MESTAGLLKLKPDCEEELEEWRQTLNSRKAEVLETLRQERVDLECWFRVDIEGEAYLLWFIRTESLAKAREIFANSENDIDAFHAEAMRKMKDSAIDADLVAGFYVDQ